MMEMVAHYKKIRPQSQKGCGFYVISAYHLKRRNYHKDATDAVMSFRTPRAYTAYEFSRAQYPILSGRSDGFS